MVRLSPHRTVSRADGWRPPALLTVVALLLMALPVSRPDGAPRRMPGGIPNTPPMVGGFPLPFPRTADYRPREGSVVAVDIDGDGRVEIIVSLPSGILTVLNASGHTLPGWPRSFAGLPAPAYPLGDPGIGDLDGDGRPEIVTCVVSGTNPRRNDLYALKTDGSDLPGWPVSPTGPPNEYYSCSPGGLLVADLDGDGRMEVARGMSSGEVVGYDGDGRRLPGWPIRLAPDENGHRRGINADLAAADLDGDGAMEVLFVESGAAPKLLAVTGRGSFMPGFPLVLPEAVGRQPPVAGDLDGDGLPEIVQTTLALSGDLPTAEPGTEPLLPAALHVLGHDGREAQGWPRVLEGGSHWGALLTDLGGDGRPEIVVQDGDRLAAFDARGALLAGFPAPIHRDFLRTQGMEMSVWRAGDLDGDGSTDLLQVRSNIYAGATYLRVFGVDGSARAVHGFPFEAEGLMAASQPVLVDLSSDGSPDLLLLASAGTGGSWSLIAWDLGSLRPGVR